MPSRPALLARLLVVISPLSVGCGERSTPGATGAAGAAPARPVRSVTVPAPPLKPFGPVASAAASALAPQDGDRPFAVCGVKDRTWPEGRSGGPYAVARCYGPPAAGQCLEATAPALRRVFKGLGTCVYDGPHAQTDPASGAPWCCYNVSQMGDGRPLFVAGERRLAALAGGWGERAGGRVTRG